jgi:hypothetical protein
MTQTDLGPQRTVGPFPKTCAFSPEHEWEIIDDTPKGQWMEIFLGEFVESVRPSIGRLVQWAKVDYLSYLSLGTVTVEIKSWSFKYRRVDIFVFPGYNKRLLWPDFAGQTALTRNDDLVSAVQGRIGEPGFAHALNQLIEGWPAEAHHTSLGFIARAEHLVARGQVDAALDLIYDNVEEYLQSQRIRDLDVLLSNVPVETTSLDTLITLLTATLPVRGQLNSRGRLFDEAERVARRSGIWEDSLLTGLQD